MEYLIFNFIPSLEIIEFQQFKVSPELESVIEEVPEERSGKR